jgi:hypothetical protein
MATGASFDRTLHDAQLTVRSIFGGIDASVRARFGLLH